MRTRRALLSFCMLFALVGASAGEETARQILDRRKQLEDTTRRWDDRHQKMKLHIFDRRGGERVRDLEFFEKKFPNDEQTALVFFLTPAEVKGTGFLSFNHKGRPADQWLYLPELKRVRQITARSRDESFVGTDLTYRDLDVLSELVSWTEDDAASSLKGEEAIGGVACYRIELVPKREDIGYQRILLWLGKDDLVPRKFEFYREGEQPVRRITQSEVKNVGAFPVAHKQEVESPEQSTRTLVEISDVQFNQGLAEDLFTQRNLERGGR